jgi:lysophospholipase L1-like esterase
MTSPRLPSPSPARANASGRRPLLFRAIALLAGLAPFLLLEIALRIFGLGRPADNPDPFAGFNHNFPLFERSGPIYRTARAREPAIALQEFPVEKPRNGFRIFCFGGSTVFGHPYLGATAFPKWLELELAGSAPARSWQVINCGGVSYASYRISPLVKEVLHYQPDLIILATGHNEFLEDRTYHTLKSRNAAWAWLQRQAGSLRMAGLARRWLTGASAPTRSLESGSDGSAALDPAVPTKLDELSGYASYHRDDAWHKRVAAQFDESVRRMVADCRAARVPVVLVRLGSNLRDCPPFKSEHRADLSAEPEADWQAAFDAGSAAEPFDLSRALKMYQEAEAIDAEYALLDYRIARVLDRLGRKPEALAHFQRARDEDVCPLRIFTPLEQSLARIAAETGAPLVDAATLLAASSPDHIPGFDWYVDHVHPTIGGHQQIARALAAQMRQSDLLDRSATWPDEQRRETYARHLASLGPAYFADGKRRVHWLENWARRQRLAAETEPNDANGFIRLGFRRLDLGEEEAAWQAFEEACKREGSVTNLILAHAQQLASEGRSERAASLRQFILSPSPSINRPK